FSELFREYICVLYLLTSVYFP
ncbi:hypothetical protein, partial [Plasmodium yoelii yoelii]